MERETRIPLIAKLETVNRDLKTVSAATTDNVQPLDDFSRKY